MDELSVLDLQNLRHLIGGYETSHKKMMEYASGASDPQIKQFFQKSAQSAMQNKQLKQTLKQLRNACETSQEEIYQLARAHQYYVPAEKASTQEIQHVKNILTQG